MEVAFETRQLRSVCESQVVASREFAPAVVKTLMSRLADMRAASSIHDLIAGNARVLKVGGDMCLMVDLACDHYMLLSANHPRNPRCEQGELDWERVRRVKVLSIGTDRAQI